MDPFHTGFTSSDSEPETERRAENSGNDSLLKLAGISLTKPGKGNSTIGLYGKNFVDYSYAAGYSTIKSTADIDSSLPATDVPKKSGSLKLKRPVNSTLIGAKYAKNVLDLTESPSGSPIPMKNKNARRTIKTFGSLHEASKSAAVSSKRTPRNTGKDSIAQVKVSSESTADSDVSKLSTADSDGSKLSSATSDGSKLSPADGDLSKLSTAAADMSRVSSAGGWVTVEDSSPNGQVCDKYAGSPPPPLGATYRRHAPSLKSVQEEASLTSELSSLNETKDSLDRLVTSLHDTCGVLQNLAKDVQDCSAAMISQSKREVRAKRNDSPINAGQVPVAYSTPLHTNDVRNFQTPPTHIEKGENSTELRPPSVSLYTLSMFEEMGDSTPDSRSQAGSNRFIQETKHTKLEGVQTHITNLEDEDEAGQRTTPEQMRTLNEATPSKLVKPGNSLPTLSGTQQRPVDERAMRQKKLVFSDNSADSNGRLKGHEKPSVAPLTNPKHNSRSGRIFTTQSPVYISPDSARTSQVQPHLHTSPGYKSPVYKSPISLDVVDNVGHEPGSSDSVTEQETAESCQDSPRLKLSIDDYSPIGHLTSPTSRSLISQTKEARIISMKYPAHIQRRMDKMCEEYQRRHPERHEATKHIPCDILTCLP